MIATRIGILCVLALPAVACSGEAEPQPSEPAAAAPTDATPTPTAGLESPRPAPPAATAPKPVTPSPPARVVTEEELQPLREAVARDLDDVAAQRNLARALWDKNLPSPGRGQLFGCLGRSDRGHGG